VKPTPHPSEAFFSSQRSWVSPFRALLQPSDRRRVSSPHLRSCAFLQNPSALHRRFNGFIPLDQPSPFLLPRLLILGRGHMLSWAFGPLKALRPSTHLQRHLRVEGPLAFLVKNDLSIVNHPNLRVCSADGLAVSLRRGRRPFWPFSPTDVSNPFNT
jgi:hypothetical protein